MNFDVSSYTKFQIFRGSAQDPAGGAPGAYSAPPDPLVGPKNPTPALGPWAPFSL